MSDREFLCNPLYYVEVMRHKYAETLVEWCCIELSHILDFSGTDSLGQVLMGNVDVKQGKTIIRKFTRHRKKDKAAIQPQLAVFGSPLSEEGYCQVRQLIEYLKDNVHVEGLFRIPGNSHRQQRLKDLLNQRRAVDLQSSEFTPHDVACVLKSFLSELPEPLLTDRHYGAHVQAADLTYKLEVLPHHTPEMLGRIRATRTTSQVKALRYLFLMLQPCTYKLLREVLELLNTVAENEESNKMNASSLGILFAPHVLWPRFLTTNDLRDQSYINKLNYAVEFMISYFNSIFKVPESMLKKCEVFVKNGGVLPDDQDERMDCQDSAKSDDELESDRRLPISRPGHAVVKVQESKNCTEEALAQLYADVQAMPDSSKKRRLMKQFAHNSYMPGTPTKVRDDAVQMLRSSERPRKHRRSRSAGEVLVKGLGTPFSSRKKRLAPNPPPQKVMLQSSSVDDQDGEIETERRMNNLNSSGRRRANTGGSLGEDLKTSMDLNIPTPAPRNLGFQRQDSSVPNRPRASLRVRKPHSSKSERPDRPTTAPPSRPVLQAQSQNITPTRKAPTAPPKKYSPFIAPPRSHSSPIEMDGNTPSRERQPRKIIPPPLDHSSPKDNDHLSRHHRSRQTPIPAPRTNTPPVASVPRKRKSDGSPVDSPMVVDSQPWSGRRPVAKPRIADRKQAFQTAV
ncbi:rho GTPase-activating protein 19-like [Diadema antillarum]|uniref:rho GTPase-activating protein 19-like n=1 Tax=Diadema antillarum TaxID=105358 RepID=UPI003A867A99